MPNLVLRAFTLSTGLALAGATLGAPPAGAASGVRDTKASMTDSPTPSKPGRADADTLAALLPAGLGDWRLTELSRPDAATSIGPPVLVKATYERGAEHVTMVVDRRPGRRKAAGRDVFRQEPANGDGAMVVITLTNGVSFAARSPTANVGELERLLHDVDLDKVESLKPVAR